MAGAPLKKGIEFIYFHLIDDIEMLDLLRLELGSVSEIIYHRLRAEIGKKQGYFMKWGNSELMKFAYNYRFHNTEHQVINEVVEYLLNIEWFDNKMYTDHGILTSRPIQDHYFSVSERRKEIEYKPEYLCPGIAELLEKINEKRNQKALEKAEKLAKKAVKNSTPEEKSETSVSAEEISLRAIIPPQNPNSINVDINRDKSEQQFELLSAIIPNNDSDNKTKERKGKESKGNERKGIFILQEEFTASDSGSVLGKALDDLIESKIESEPADPDQSAEQENPLDAEKKESSAGGPKKKKPPHPARAKIIASWEKHFELVYTQSYDNNTSIVRIIKCLEGIVKSRGHPEVEFVQRIADTWNHVLNNWQELDEFYSKQISFTSIDKNFENILNQIRERKNGGSKNSGKQGIAATRKVETGKPFRSSRTSDK